MEHGTIEAVHLAELVGVHDGKTDYNAVLRSQLILNRCVNRMTYLSDLEVGYQLGYKLDDSLSLKVNYKFFRKNCPHINLQN